MLEECLAARIPLITAVTNDPAHLPAILKHLSGLDTAKLSSGAELKNNCVRWRLSTLPSNPLSKTEARGSTSIQESLFHWFRDNDSTLVWVNPDTKKIGPMWFDAGIVPTPPEMIFEMLSSAGLSAENIGAIERSLGGLTLKEIEWVIRLSQSVFKSTGVRAIAEVRTKYFPHRRGLAPVKTSMPFYQIHPPLEDWINDARKFLHSPYPRLRPRGLLFHGEPGTGKSMAAKRISSEIGLPLFRLEMGGIKNKYVGESEKYMTEALREIDREAPCVVLIDEVEKVFASQSDHGTTSSLLASLLWWLQEHESPVLTVMTTNDLKSIPPEVYRPGRIDTTMRMDGIHRKNAKKFITGYATTFKVKLPATQVEDIVDEVYPCGSDANRVSHAQLAAHTLQYVKELVEQVQPGKKPIVKKVVKK